MTRPEIRKILIDGYRCFEHLELTFGHRMNIIVGDNESGKSTLLEALSLALTGRVNGRWAAEELSPYWFTRKRVAAFFDLYDTPQAVAPPEVLIEVYLSDSTSLQRLRGVNNSLNEDCPGVSVHVAPSPDYSAEFKTYMAESPPHILPVEFYSVDWEDFSGLRLIPRPKALATSYIDARTVRSTSGVDYHTREMLNEHLDAQERTKVAIAHRKAKQEITEGTLADINARIASEGISSYGSKIGLQMDQSSRTSWEAGVVPEVDGIPFAMAGQGAQATVKVALALSRTAGAATFVLIEEPENHLSYTTLTRLLGRIESLASIDQQLFVATHSSFVLNRLGLDRLVLLATNNATRLTDLPDETVRYFRKLSGYDTLRLVLAAKLALVEGPSDAIILSRAFRDATGVTPEEAGVDIVSMGGLSFRHALQVCAKLDRDAVAVRDNDGHDPAAMEEKLKPLLQAGKRYLLVSNPAQGMTLEPQLVAAGNARALLQILKIEGGAALENWMADNKTETALRIHDSHLSIAYPEYIKRAVDLLR